MFSYLKFRVQRQLRRFRRELRLGRRWTVNYFERHIWGKWQQLGIIRRFMIIWWAILAISFIGLYAQGKALDKAYLVAGPEAGGVYSEGIVGSVKSMNPILSDGDAESDVSRLIFSGLTRLGPDGQLEGDLASRWEVSGDGKTYTFHLRPGLKWQDGAPVTAEDVVFTLRLIQNPDTRSPLASSWQGVDVKADDTSTVSFILPNQFSPFIYSTDFGILPLHLLNGVDPASLRVSTFNQQPIGTGPFKFVQESPDGSDIELAPNGYYYFGQPLLEQFEFHLYSDTASMLEAYSKHQINAISRINASQEGMVGDAKLHAMSLMDEVGLFMRTTSPNLTDSVVRTAIAEGVNRASLVKTLGDDAARSVELPILPGQVGYTAKDQPPAYDPAAAAAALDGDGWTAGGGGRQKNGKSLSLTLVTAKSGDFPKLAAAIATSLGKIGIKVKVITADTADLQQSYIRPRNYDLLLYGISIGPDPDVYAYWQSSQALDPGLNLSEYNNSVVDRSLESARLTTDNAIRAARYDKFLAQWTTDVPAVMLYSPSYLYATNPDVMGITASRLGDATDRFYGVETWTVNTRPAQRQISN